jgi:hypothetical protein
VVGRSGDVVESGFSTYQQAWGWITDQSRPVEWHRQRIAQACRGMFECGGVIEDALDAVMLAAQHEFGISRIVVHRPAELRIDGFEYRWPLNGDGHGQA